MSRRLTHCVSRARCQFSAMSKPILRALLLGFFCLTIAFPASAAPAKRNITEKDLFDFVWIGSPLVSSDGSQVVYVRVTVDKKKTGYDTSIWMVPADGKEAPRLRTRPVQPFREFIQIFVNRICRAHACTPRTEFMPRENRPQFCRPAASDASPAVVRR